MPCAGTAAQVALFLPRAPAPEAGMRGDEDADFERYGYGEDIWRMAGSCLDDLHVGF